MRDDNETSALGCDGAITFCVFLFGTRENSQPTKSGANSRKHKQRRTLPLQCLFISDNVFFPASEIRIWNLLSYLRSRGIESTEVFDLPNSSLSVLLEVMRP